MGETLTLQHRTPSKLLGLVFGAVGSLPRRTGAVGGDLAGSFADFCTRKGYSNRTHSMLAPDTVIQNISVAIRPKMLA